MKKLALIGLIVAAVLASSFASARGWHHHRHCYRSYYSYGRSYYTPSYYSYGYYAPSYYYPSTYSYGYCAPSYRYYAPSYGYYAPRYYSPSYLSFGYHHRGTGFSFSIGGW